MLITPSVTLTLTYFLVPISSRPSDLSKRYWSKAYLVRGQTVVHVASGLKKTRFTLLSTKNGLVSTMIILRWRVSYLN